MKTLSTPVSNEASAEQGGWYELIDVYLKGTISTPWGTTNILRLTTVPGGVTFFTPKISPEAVGNRGVSQAYNYWPFKRETIKASSQSTTDKLSITASNVTQDWAQMLSAISWYDVPVLIRKVPFASSVLTADDCVPVFSGLVDSARVSYDMINMEISNDFSTFNVKRPAEPMHANCRFNWGDDQCTALKYRAENFKSKTVGSGSTQTVVKSAGLTEDTGSKATYGTNHVDGLAQVAFQPSSYMVFREGYKVQGAYPGEWWAWDSAGTDWGEQKQGTYQLPDAQAGLKNPLLKPHLEIDFGAARALKLWRYKNNGIREQAPRLLLLFSSNDGNWKFERYMEMPPTEDVFFEFNVHGAQSARYWRTCIRSRWSETNHTAPIAKIQAYEDSRNYWASGRIVFSSSTTTAALRGLSRAVMESYAGEIHVPKLPVAPVSGDTFTIERGCPRTFNGCAERLNTENYGGFDSLPFETVPR